MAKVVSVETSVETVNGELVILISLDGGGAVLAPLATMIGEIDGEFLRVVVQPWLAERLQIGAGSLVIVDNLNGKFTITRSAANDCRSLPTGPRGAVEYQEKANVLRNIAAMSFDEAAPTAQQLLRNPQHFRCVEAPRGDKSLESFAPRLRQILERYAEVAAVGDPGTSVQRAAIAPAVHAAGFVRIGWVNAGIDTEGELAVRAGEETIYELHPGEPGDSTFGTYRSIYHWIIAAASEGKA
jgi:hypothetical protein